MRLYINLNSVKNTSLNSRRSYIHGEIQVLIVKNFTRQVKVYLSKKKTQ